MSCHYTGKEPSPKGLGMCAHNGAYGDVKRGKDGNMWTISADKNGRLHWIKLGAVKRAPVPTRAPLTTTKKAAKRQGQPLKRVKNMQEAKAAVRTLLANEDLQDSLRSRNPGREVQYFPQVNARVRWAGVKDPPARSYMAGQFSYAPKLGVVYWPEDMNYDGLRPISRKTMQGFAYADQKGMYVSGSGSDPVLEVL